MASGESLVDIAAAASQTALERAGIRPADLDAIIIGTVSSEYGFPSFACQLQHRLGLDSIPAYDVAAACSGFIYTLSVADNAMRVGDYSRVLLVGADALSTMVDWNDRAVAVLFGDGAGAAVMVSEPGPRGVLASLLRSAGEYWHYALGASHRRARHARLGSAALARRRDQDEGAGAVQDRGALDG
jgi:3-oxoacyl-[acyl-carrier-protein] synthase-3